MTGGTVREMDIYIANSVKCERIDRGDTEPRGASKSLYIRSHTTPPQGMKGQPVNPVEPTTTEEETMEDYRKFRSPRTGGQRDRIWMWRLRCELVVHLSHGQFRGTRSTDRRPTGNATDKMATTVESGAEAQKDRPGVETRGCTKGHERRQGVQKETSVASRHTFSPRLPLLRLLTLHLSLSLPVLFGQTRPLWSNLDELFEISPPAPGMRFLAFSGPG